MSEPIQNRILFILNLSIGLYMVLIFFVPLPENPSETPVGIIGGNEGPTTTWISPTPTLQCIALSTLLLVNAYAFHKRSRSR